MYCNDAVVKTHRSLSQTFVDHHPESDGYVALFSFIYKGRLRRDVESYTMKALSVVLFLLVACSLVSAFARNRPEGNSRPSKEQTLPTAGRGARIGNGSPAERGQFPHMAALFVQGMFSCGGALIHPKHVITAGRCVFGVSQVDVYLGAQDLSASEEGRVTQTSQTYVVHPGYKPFPYVDDLAIVRLPEAVVFNDFVQPIALPSTPEDTFEGSPATISGWGKTSMDTATYSSTLNFVTLTIISNAECSLVYTEIVPSILCASAPGKGICYFDVGGPLVVQKSDDTSATLIGVSSFINSFGCDSGAPSGYSRVTSYIPWIADTIGN